MGVSPQKYDKILKNYIFYENFLKFVKSVKNYENSLKKSKNQDFNDFQYQPPLTKNIEITIIIIITCACSSSIMYGEHIYKNMIF